MRAAGGKKEMKKVTLRRFGTGILATLMVFGMSAVTSINVHAANSGEVWVNGIDITNTPDNTVTCGSGTAVYEPSTATLTLNNATITERNDFWRAVGAEDTDLIISLIGNNTIIPTDKSVYPIYSGTDITISGEGSLTTAAEATNIYSLTGVVTIDGITLSAKSTEGFAINGEIGIIAQNGSVLDCEGFYGGFHTSNDMNISASTVNVSSTDVGEYTMPAICAFGSLMIENNSIISAKSMKTPVFSGKDMKISNSYVSAESTSGAGISANGALNIVGESEIISIGGIYSLTTAYITPAADKTIEVYAGADEESAVLVEGAPFASKTDLLNLLGNDHHYFYSKTHSHTASATWLKDATNHWHVCTTDSEKMESASHTYGEWVIDTPATEKTEGSKHRDCSVCAYKETTAIPVLTHIHTASTKWMKDAANHWLECIANDGVKMESAPHTYGEWVIDLPATENRTGSKHRDCTICGQKETIEIPINEVSVPEIPAITVGGGFYYQISAGNNMTLTCSGKLEDLTGIYVDGTLVDESNYILKSGSTILTIKASYLDTLSAGKHTLKFLYKDNISVDTDFTINTKNTSKNVPDTKEETPKKNQVTNAETTPKTGDNSNSSAYAFILLLSGCAVGIVVSRRKKDSIIEN